MNDQTPEARISVRIPKGSDLKQRLEDVVQLTGLSESTLVLRSIEAVVEYIELNQRITLPFAVHEQSKEEVISRSARTLARTAKIIPIVAAVLAGCCALIDCELLDLNLLF
jgi:predicted DNA-binding protein